MYNLLFELLNLPAGYEKYIVGLACALTACLTLMLSDFIICGFKKLLKLRKE